MASQVINLIYDGWFLSQAYNPQDMASAFHWVKVKAVCYATENEDLIHDVMMELTGAEDDECFDVDISEGLHGNPITVIDVNLKHSKEFERLFKNIGIEPLKDVLDHIEERVDDDCILYMRLDKQKAVGGVYEISHSGDVISITAKVVAHPAKKEIAVENAKQYLTRFALPSGQAPSSQ